MVYDIALWAGAILLGIGIIHRIDAWFLRDVGLGDRGVPAAGRFVTGSRAFWRPSSADASSRC